MHQPLIGRGGRRAIRGSSCLCEASPSTPQVHPNGYSLPPPRFMSLKGSSTCMLHEGLACGVFPATGNYQSRHCVSHCFPLAGLDRQAVTHNHPTVLSPMPERCWAAKGRVMCVRCVGAEVESLVQAPASALKPLWAQQTAACFAFKHRVSISTTSII